MIVGGYTLDLYCDTLPNCPHRDIAVMSSVSLYGRNERDTMKQAREKGWTFSRDRASAYCPKCSKEQK